MKNQQICVIRWCKIRRIICTIFQCFFAYGSITEVCMRQGNKHSFSPLTLNWYNSKNAAICPAKLSPAQCTAVQLAYNMATWRHFYLIIDNFWGKKDVWFTQPFVYNVLYILNIYAAQTNDIFPAECECWQEKAHFRARLEFAYSNYAGLSWIQYSNLFLACIQCISGIYIKLVKFIYRVICTL